MGERPLTGGEQARHQEVLPELDLKHVQIKGQHPPPAQAERAQGGDVVGEFGERAHGVDSGPGWTAGPRQAACSMKIRRLCPEDVRFPPIP